MAGNLRTNEDGVAAVANKQPHDYKFDVFLSYSRKDELFGKKLEEALESYRLPKQVKASLIARNRLNVFRDKQDLVPTDSDYYQTIARYLKESAFLVVICSPNARRSSYVNQEIQAFLESHEPNRIVPILLSGKPNNDTAASPDEYAFPDALCAALSMPLAVEFTQFERAPGRLHKGLYRDSWYTLLSKIFGTERAEIEQLDAKRRARSRAIFAAVSIVIIAVLSIALVFAVISRQRALNAEQQATRERDHTRRLLYASDMSLAQQSFATGNVAMGKKTLESYLPTNQPGQEDLRGFEWYYLWRLYHQELAGFDADDVAFLRDGSRFATVKGDTVRVWDAATITEKQSFKLNAGSKADNSNGAEHTYSAIDFSPDGKTLAYGDSERGTLLLDLAAGASKKLPLPALNEAQRESSVFGDDESIQNYWELAGGGTPRFSPDARLIAVDYGCGVAALYDARSLKNVATLGNGPPASGCTSFVTFSPDSRLLAYGNDYSVSIWDTVESRDLGSPASDESQPDSVGQVEAVAFSPDGKILAIGDRSQQLILWNIATKRVLARLKGHEGWISALGFSRDGKTLYSGSTDLTVKLWDFGSYKGDGQINSEKIKVVGTLKGHTGYIRTIVCSAANNLVATVGYDQTVKLWSKQAGREFDAIENVTAVSPNADRIARFSDEEPYGTTVYDLHGDKPSAPWLLKGTSEISFSPDNKTAVTPYHSAAGVTTKIWDLNTHQELGSINFSCTFSGDGSL